MGIWGTGIFDDDLALDIKAEYESLFSGKFPHEDIVLLILENRKDVLKDTEESNVIWLSLAAVQVNYRVITKNIKKKALDIIDSNADLERWLDNPDLCKKRQNTLEYLKSQILQL